MRHPCKVSHHHAQGHSVGEQVYKVDHFQHFFFNVFSLNIPENYSVQVFGTIILNNNSIYILQL